MAGVGLSLYFFPYAPCSQRPAAYFCTFNSQASSHLMASAPTVCSVWNTHPSRTPYPFRSHSTQMTPPQRGLPDHLSILYYNTLFYCFHCNHYQPEFFLMEGIPTYHKINHFKVPNSVAFGTFTLMVQPPSPPVPKHSHQPPKETICPLAVTTHTPVPSSRHPLICFLSLRICLFWTFPMNRIIRYVL